MEGKLMNEREEREDKREDEAILQSIREMQEWSFSPVFKSNDLKSVFKPKLLKLNDPVLREMIVGKYRVEDIDLERTIHVESMNVVQAIERAASQAHQEYAWECDWPRAFMVVRPDGKTFRLKVERETIPEFIISKVAEEPDEEVVLSFTDQKQRVATAEDLSRRWSARRPGEGFRCYLCGHKFQVGDRWRWIWASQRGVINPLVCEKCDGPDVLDRWVEHAKRLHTAYWWAL